MSDETQPDLQRWLPTKWSEFVGNKAMMFHMRSLVELIRKGYERTGVVPAKARQALMLTGQSRSGKTAMVKFAVRCMTCCELDAQLNPCAYRCRACRQSQELYGMEGLFSEMTVGPKQPTVNLTVVDCTKIHTPKDLMEVLSKAQDVGDALRVMYFDEVHRLVPRSMDEMLLKEVEDKKILWICSTAMPGNLEEMFLNRFLHLSTELPGEEELQDWTVDRCDERGIAFEVEAIVRLVEKSNCVPGHVLRALAMADINPSGLTCELVEHWSPRVECDE